MSIGCGLCDEDCKHCNNDDCLDCPCQDGYETNITCEVCLHDMLYCDCTEEEKQKRVDDLIAKLTSMYNDYVQDWGQNKKS